MEIFRVYLANTFLLEANMPLANQHEHRKNLLLAYPFSLILATLIYLHVFMDPAVASPYVFLSLKETVKVLLFFALPCGIPYLFIGRLYATFIQKSRIPEYLKVVGLIACTTCVNLMIHRAIYLFFEGWD